jgi:hypothetical protein
MAPPMMDYRECLVAEHRLPPGDTIQNVNTAFDVPQNATHNALL